MPYGGGPARYGGDPVPYGGAKSGPDGALPYERTPGGRRVRGGAAAGARS